MPKVSEIEDAILRLEGGAYQGLMNAYLYDKYGFGNIHPLGSQVGTDKTTKGIPDAYIKLKDGKYIYIMYGTVKTTSFKKLKEDILSVKNDAKSNVPYSRISRLLCCHTSSNITPTQDAELQKLFPNLELVGISTVATDLFFKYPLIAREYLNIAIDTNQILSYNDFVKKSGSSGLATPLGFCLVGRDSEKKEILENIKNHSALIISGKSGVGKTRIALEVAKDFLTQNSYKLKCILNNGENIYNDIAIHFPDTENYFILIDDANLLSHLNHFMDMTRVSARKYKVKIILTTRDYAKGDLIRKLSEYPDVKTYTLSPLKEEDIQKIVKDNFGFNNRSLLKKIYGISKDNVRIAVMAAKCAQKKDWDKINDATEIFDSYFGKTIACLSEKEIIVASFVSFFQRIKISEDHLILDFLKKFNINYAEFYDIARSLHQKEIVDVYNDIAIKFSEQIFGDYLLYYAFSKQKITPAKNLILNSFPKYRDRIVALLMVSLHIFHNKKITDYLISQVKESWQEIEKLDRDIQTGFIEAFHSILEDEGLFFISQELKSLPDSNINFLDFDIKNQATGDASKLLNILASYKKSDKFETALDLIIFYIEKKAKTPSDIYNIFSNQLFIDQESHASQYKKEIFLVSYLEQCYQKTKNDNLSVVLAFFAGQCLRFDCTQHISHGNRSVEILTIPMGFSKEALVLRGNAIRILSSLYANMRLRGLIERILLEYDPFSRNKWGKPILKQDLKLFARFCKKHLSHKSFDSCLVLQHFYDLAKRNKIVGLSKFNYFTRNRLFKVFSIASKWEYSKTKKQEELHKEKIIAIQKLTSSFNKKDFSLLFSTIKNSKLLKFKNQFPYGAIAVILEAQTHKKEQYSEAFEAYLQQPLAFLNANIQSSLWQASQALGVKDTLALIKGKESRDKEVLLSYFYQFIPLELVNDEIIKEILSLLGKKASNSDICVLNLQKAIEINRKLDGFAYSYLKTTFDLFNGTPMVIKSFLSCFGIENKEDFKNIVHILSPVEDTQTLKSAYILAAAKDDQSMFDFKRYFFQAIYERDNSFIEDIVELSKENLVGKDVLDIFDNVWELDNYSEIIWKTVEAIYKAMEDKKYLIHLRLSNLFSFLGGHINIKNRDVFLKEYMDKYCDDIIRMRDLFGAMDFLNLSDKKVYILYLCSKTSSIDIFKDIHLYSGTNSWSGSYVPVIDKEINTLREIQEELKGTEYLEHRDIIGRRISILEQEKRDVIMKEFLEEDD